MQFLGRHAPAFQRAGAEILDQHIGLFEQGLGHILPLRLAQVQRHGFLIARLHLPPHGGAILDHAPVAQRVACFRRFNLDDLSAKLAQGLACKGAGNQLPHLYDPYTGQCAGLQTLRNLLLHCFLFSMPGPDCPA